MVQMDGVHHLLTLTPLLIKGLKIPDLIVHEALKANACCNGNGRGGRRQILPHCICNPGVNANVWSVGNIIGADGYHGTGYGMG